jgi:hypothetical protein
MDVLHKDIIHEKLKKKQKINQSSQATCILLNVHLMFINIYKYLSLF